MLPFCPVSDYKEENQGETLQYIISFAVIAILVTALLLVLRWGRLRLWGGDANKSVRC
jgi:hypothetical protein